MRTTLKKWGNSQAIRIPKTIIEKARIKENDQVELNVVSGTIVIQPIKKHKTLKERIKDYNGDYRCSEWESGQSVGKEVL